MRNLWPEDFDKDENGRFFPERILEYQAQELKNMTKGNVIGEVTNTVPEFNAGLADDTFLNNKNIYTFVVKCSCNNDLNIFSISYDNHIYPLKIRVYDEISDEIEKNLPKFIPNNGIYRIQKYYNIENEEEFESILECIFNTHAIKRILHFETTKEVVQF